MSRYARVLASLFRVIPSEVEDDCMKSLIPALAAFVLREGLGPPIDRSDQLREPFQESLVFVVRQDLLREERQRPKGLIL
jgi:hypothetical protein